MEHDAGDTQKIGALPLEEGGGAKHSPPARTYEMNRKLRRTQQCAAGGEAPTKFIAKRTRTAMLINIAMHHAS